MTSLFLASLLSESPGPRPRPSAVDSCFISITGLFSFPQPINSSSSTPPYSAAESSRARTRRRASSSTTSSSAVSKLPQTLRHAATCMHGCIVNLATNCYSYLILQEALDCEEEDVCLLIVLELPGAIRRRRW
ncbi:hypothetical protein B0H16DRAFT_133136 [Mycena metata]|uniref:Uncharacterized protein n=1 Tax=Mycena metata TaxID=1033252 RepID=A0AAD7MXQ0_9AGAR|nr:hypothetical protein B0H16DRAFT_133136 [Mycena metata]